MEGRALVQAAAQSLQAAKSPQGGVLSPLLANIALHGLETHIVQKFPKKSKWINGKTKQIQSPVALVRYADDFVVMHEDLSVVEQCQQLICDWLAEVGLTLHPEKTKITHTLKPFEGRVGFDFLGFNVRQYPVGKYGTGKTPQGVPQGFKTLIMPSKEAVRRQRHKLKQEVRFHLAATQGQLIDKLNPRIRGWANYYAKAVSQAVFDGLDHWLYRVLKRWATRRHPRKSQGWIARRYWLIDRGEGWVFADTYANQVRRRLVKHQHTPIRRHVKVKGTASLFDGDWLYWSQRLQHHPMVNSTMATLLRRQKGKCASCGLWFTSEDHLWCCFFGRP